MVKCGGQFLESLKNVEFIDFIDFNAFFKVLVHNKTYLHISRFLDRKYCDF